MMLNAKLEVLPSVGSLGQTGQPLDWGPVCGGNFTLGYPNSCVEDTAPENSEEAPLRRRGTREDEEAVREDQERRKEVFLEPEEEALQAACPAEISMCAVCSLSV